MTMDVYVDVLEDHVAEFVQLQMKDLSWKYDYYSKIGSPNKHWHVLCGKNPKEILDDGYEWVLPIWDTAKIKYKFKEKRPARKKFLKNI